MAKSKLRKDVEEIPQHKRSLHRSLTKISRKVAVAMNEQDIGYEELEKKIDRWNEERPGEFIQRMLGGGINLSLRTIYKLEEVLGVELIDVMEPDVEEPKRRRRSRD